MLERDVVWAESTSILVDEATVHTTGNVRLWPRGRNKSIFRVDAVCFPDGREEAGLCHARVSSRPYKCVQRLRVKCGLRGSRCPWKRCEKLKERAVNTISVKTAQAPGEGFLETTAGWLQAESSGRWPSRKPAPSSSLHENQAFPCAPGVCRKDSGAGGQDACRGPAAGFSGTWASSMKVTAWPARPRRGPDHCAEERDTPWA